MSVATPRQLRERRHRRVRGKVAGTAERPRLSVFRSNLGIGAQLVDDQSGRTVIETSGFSWKPWNSVTWHEHKLVRENDADKQAILEASGYRVLRITREQTRKQPVQTLRRVRAALAATS